MYFKYRYTKDPTDYEIQMLEMYKQTMDCNNIKSITDIDKLKRIYSQYENYLTKLADRQEQLKRDQLVYADILAYFADHRDKKRNYVEQLIEKDERLEEEKALVESEKEKEKEKPKKKHRR